MKKYIVLLGIIIFLQGANFAQLSTKELPVSFSLDESVAYSEENAKIMPPLDMDIIAKEDIEDEMGGLPPRFGYPHKVNYNLNNSGQWSVLSNGDKIWRLEISCPNALSINLLYDKFWVPEESKFFIYSQDKKHTMGAFTSKNNKGSQNEIKGFATGLIYGDKIILEYYQPKDVKEQGVISIAHVVQGYRYINVIENTKDFGDAGDCQVNVNCSEGQNWKNEKNAVALILVGGIRWCTG